MLKSVYYSYTVAFCFQDRFSFYGVKKEVFKSTSPSQRAGGVCRKDKRF